LTGRSSTFPDVLFLGAFKTSLKEVGSGMAMLKNDKGNEKSDEEKLSQAFEEGFEADAVPAQSLRRIRFRV